MSDYSIQTDYESETDSEIIIDEDTTLDLLLDELRILKLLQLSYPNDDDLLSQIEMVNKYIFLCKFPTCIFSNETGICTKCQKSDCKIMTLLTCQEIHPCCQDCWEEKDIWVCPLCNRRVL